MREKVGGAAKAQQVTLKYVHESVEKDKKSKSQEAEAEAEYNQKMLMEANEEVRQHGLSITQTALQIGIENSNNLDQTTLL